MLTTDSSKKGQDVKVSAEMTVASVLTGETVVKVHSLEDTTANIPEIKEKSDTGSSPLPKIEFFESEEMFCPNCFS